MKIAIVFDGDIYRQRGEFIAIRNRIKELQKYQDIETEIYVCKSYIGSYADKIFKFNTGERVGYIYLDNIKYRCVWIKKSYIESIMRKLLKRGTNHEYNYLKKTIDLSKYDLVYAHSLNAGLLALDNKIKNKIPYVMLWHGSSIHTTPFKDKNCYYNTQKVLKNADLNLFVSQELQEIADNISHNIGSITLNGIDTDIYKQYSDTEKEELRSKYNIALDYQNIAFIGNCYPVKNVKFLPRLFSAIKEYNSKTHFFLIGSGDFDNIFKYSNIKYTCINNIQNSDMPDIYNLMDLIVLPSINEGLPMTCLEATACGTNFIGSRVGGIAEVVGLNKTIPWSDSFETDFINLCISTLESKNEQIKLPEKFMLSKVVSYEYNLILKIVKLKS